MPPGEMIERVARAIDAALGRRDDARSVEEMAHNVASAAIEAIRPEGVRIAIIIVPDGYLSAEEFALDCGFELVK